MPTNHEPREETTNAETGKPRRRLLLLLPLALFIALAGLFLSQLLLGQRYFRGAVGADRPAGAADQPAGARRHRPTGPAVKPICRQAKMIKRVRVVVRAMPRGASGAAHVVARQALFDGGAELQRPDRKTHGASSVISAIRFPAIGVDEAGRTAIDWGVYGVPETFVIGKDGRIAYKHVGPLTRGFRWKSRLLLPQIEKARVAPD